MEQDAHTLLSFLACNVITIVILREAFPSAQTIIKALCSCIYLLLTTISKIYDACNSIDSVVGFCLSWVCILHKITEGRYFATLA